MPAPRERLPQVDGVKPGQSRAAHRTSGGSVPSAFASDSSGRKTAAPTSGASVQRPGVEPEAVGALRAADHAVGQRVPDAEAGVARGRALGGVDVRHDGRRHVRRLDGAGLGDRRAVVRDLDERQDGRPCLLRRTCSGVSSGGGVRSVTSAAPARACARGCRPRSRRWRTSIGPLNRRSMTTTSTPQATRRHSARPQVSPETYAGPSPRKGTAPPRRGQAWPLGRAGRVLLALDRLVLAVRAVLVVRRGQLGRGDRLDAVLEVEPRDPPPDAVQPRAGTADAVPSSWPPSSVQRAERRRAAPAPSGRAPASSSCSSKTSPSSVRNTRPVSRPCSTFSRSLRCRPEADPLGHDVRQRRQHEHQQRAAT